MKLNKTLLAVIIASTTSAAYADLNKAIDLVDGLTHKSISFDEGHSEWQNMDSETQREAHQYDHAQGTHFTSDYREGEHTEYARGEATATYHEAAQSDVKPVYSGESHRPAMTTTQDDLASAHSARTVNQHVDYNAQVVAAHDIEAAKVKGKLLTDANIARTANQRVDYNAQVVAAHDIEAAKVKGKLLTDANIARTANQRVDYNAQVVAAHDIEAAKVKGKLLTDANIARTANQRVDYNAQVVAAHDIEAAKVKGKLLTDANIARTANQRVDYNAQVVAAHDIEAAKVKGKLLTDANIARTANQRVDYNAQVVAAHDIEAAKVKGKLLTDANIARTANQRVDYNAQVVAAHDIEAAKVKGKLLTDANIARTANQRVDYNAQVVETHDVEAARVKGKLLTNANIARTADQHTTQSALTHATATATPDIDRTQHLDSNATGQDRQTAKLNAVMEQSQVNADAVKGLQLVQANQRRTASQHVTEEPHNGIDGKTGAQGEKGDAGVTTTITKVQTDTATQTQVAQNQTTLRHVQEEQTAQGEYVQHMNQTVSHTATLAASNSQRLNAVESHQKSLEQQQSNDREEYRAGIAGAVAISGLHYTETDNSVAIGAGDFKNEQGYALGYRHKFSDNVATTVAASETSNGDAMFSASAAIGW